MKRQQDQKRMRYRFVRGRSSALLSLCAVLVVACWLFFGVQSASAVTCYIDAQPEETQVGQSVTVTVVFSGDDVGRVRATLEYDKSVLSYQGEGGDTGEVSLYMAGSGNGISYSLPFKAVGGGTCMLVMTPLDAYNMDEMSIDLPESQAMPVTVEAPEEPEPPKTEPEDPQDDPSSTEPEDDPQQEPAQPEEPEEEPEDGSASHATIWVLGGLALLVALILIAVLLHRSSRDED